MIHGSRDQVVPLENVLTAELLNVPVIVARPDHFFHARLPMLRWRSSKGPGAEEEIPLFHPALSFANQPVNRRKLVRALIAVGLPLAIALARNEFLPAVYGAIAGFYIASLSITAARLLRACRGNPLHDGWHAAGGDSRSGRTLGSWRSVRTAARFRGSGRLAAGGGDFGRISSASTGRSPFCSAMARPACRRSPGPI